MKRRYRLSRLAQTDLVQTWNYLAENVSFEVADKILADLREAIAKLATSPELGHSRSDLTDRRVRFFRVHRYLIIYNFDSQPLEISRVVHASRDIQAILNR